MKQTVLIMLFASVPLLALAQRREVKLPEKPHQTGYRDYES